LKADVYRTQHCELSVEDQAIVAREGSGHDRINWNQWHGEPVIYRTIAPGQIKWSDLPEIAILLEPIIGERIIYNPFLGSSAGRSEAESRERIRHIWQELYGREPQAVLRTFPRQMVLSGCAEALQSMGHSPRSARDVYEWINKLLPHEQDGRLMGILMRMTPFALEDEPAPSNPATPFLLIQDNSLFGHAAGERLRIEPTRWKSASCTQSPRDSTRTDVGGIPVVIYTGRVVDQEVTDVLSRANICDLQDSPQQLPTISWNYLSELTTSEGMHVGTQPFMLREYARHVAGLWEKEYGRRPAVHALTGVSLNGRPFQPLVDPRADLASVSAAWLRHNPWIMDLATPRIPGGVLAVNLGPTGSR
jgi:hypothetical protein